MAYTFDPTGLIEIPSDKLREAVKAAYDFSRPQGMGFLHARPGSLEDSEIDELLSRKKSFSSEVVYMDYVHGRACKFSIYENDGKHYINGRWFDHGDYLLEELLKALGVEDARAMIVNAQAAR